MIKRLLNISLLSLSCAGIAHGQGYPDPVTKALTQAGKNRPELERAIALCKKTGDPLKVKAAYFLIANMPYHHADDFYYADDAGKAIDFDELKYPTYEEAMSAFGKLSAQRRGVHAVTITRPDVETVRADFLIANIESALRHWKNSVYKNIPFSDFCEYVLPYRVSVEPLQQWRGSYKDKYSWLTDSLRRSGVRSALYKLALDNKKWFSTTYGIEERKEPLPRLGALQLLSRKKGPCEDIADLQVFALRAQGVPASLNIIPQWATSTGSHFINTVFDPTMKAIQFDESRPDPLLNKMLASEPSKVIRTTFARQSGTLADLVPISDIPNNFLRTVTYVDITNQYWETTNVTCTLFPADQHPVVAYACVFNGLTWKPTWWGKVHDGKATFSNMSKGVVYLPMYYKDRKLSPAGVPVAEGYHHEQQLIADEGKRITVSLKEQNKYLEFHTGKRYRLFYWDAGWKLLAAQKAQPEMHTMLFTNVPADGLYLLLPDDSQKKERPFIITESGQRNWF